MIFDSSAIFACGLILEESVVFSPVSLPSFDRKSTCCFSGYRPHKFPFPFHKHNPAFRELESDLLNAVLQSYNEGYRTFLCGGAMGFDLLAAEIVLLIKKNQPDIRLFCILPFEGQAKDFPLSWSQRYHKVLEQCDFIEYVQPHYTKGCYTTRNEKMVDSSSRVITFYDGQRGGTARTLSYAQTQKLDVINLCQTSALPEQVQFYLGY